MENKKWIVRYYDKKGNLISWHYINDRTEHEAENEAMADMPCKCEDWSLTPAPTEEEKREEKILRLIGMGIISFKRKDTLITRCLHL